MSEDNRCERCRGEIKHLAYHLRLEMEGEPEPVLAITVCDYCRKSFDGWVARRKRTGKGRSSSKERADLSSHRSSSSRSGSSKRSSSSHDSSSDSLLETAKSGLSSMIEAARSGMIDEPDQGLSQVMSQPAMKSKKKKRRPREEDEDYDYDDEEEEEGEDLRSITVDSRTNFLITLVVVISVFFGIGLVLYYLTVE